MALELATRLILRDAATGGPLPAEVLRRLVAAWSDVPDAADVDVRDARGRGGGLVSSTTIDEGATGLRWDLVLRRPDDSDPSVTWTASLTGLFQADRTTMVTRLRRDASDHRLRPLSGSPQPPAVIRVVLSAPEVDCFDGPVRIEPRWRKLCADEVGGFVELVLTAKDRRLPVLGVAMAGAREDGRLDVQRLVQELAGFAHIVLIERAALAGLGREIGDLSVGTRSARLWWPALGLDDSGLTHPHFRGPFGDPRQLSSEIRREILEVSRDRWREPNRLLLFERARRARREEAGRAAAARVAAELARLHDEVAATREDRRVAGARDAEAEAAEAAREAHLASLAADLQGLRDDLELQRVATADAEAMWEEAEAKCERLESEVRALRGRNEGLLAQLRESALSDGEAESDEDLFCRQVAECWTERLTADDRRFRPLAEFVALPGFVSSISTAAADRGKVVEVAMEAVCGLVRDMPGRALHRLRESAGGNSPPRVRERDGALAWRCSVQSNSPSARRLHYWQCPDGRIELANVVVHDDFSIPE